MKEMMEYGTGLQRNGVEALEALEALEAVTVRLIDLSHQGFLQAVLRGVVEPVG